MPAAASTSASPANVVSNHIATRCSVSDAPITLSIVITSRTGWSGSTSCSALITDWAALLGGVVVRMTNEPYGPGTRACWHVHSGDGIPRVESRQFHVAHHADDFSRRVRHQPERQVLPDRIGVRPEP